MLCAIIHSSASSKNSFLLSVKEISPMVKGRQNATMMLGLKLNLPADGVVEAVVMTVVAVA